MSRSAKRAWLGLGGNIGDVEQAMGRALTRLDADADVTVAKVSPIYKTPPWGVEDQAWFLNCCVEITTQLSPEDLLVLCQTAEREGKRQRVQRWGPRTIDIDIVAFEGIEQTEQRLTIPHPRATERAFVIIPLADIAPDLPLAGKPVRQWLLSIDGEGVELADVDRRWWFD
jgi:2-amino-4-hydroxy-6-hydroxymethyldihydropteridine diphosphokinase